MTAPQIGDKVVYAPLDGPPRRESWRRRAEHLSLVVADPDNDGYLTCWSLWESKGDGWWCAPPERLRVVERATYTPVEEASHV